MKKLLIMFFCLGILFIISWCATQSQVDQLESENYDLELRVSELEGIIDNCNYGIEDAQSYAWSDYEDMEYALESLETCYY